MSKFKVGEVAILHNLTNSKLTTKTYSHLNGTECTVFIIRDYDTEHPYGVNTVDGKRVVSECELRKKRDDYDREETCTWESCEWQPEGVVA